MIQFLMSTLNNKLNYENIGLNIDELLIVNQVDKKNKKSAEVWADYIRTKGGMVFNAAERGLSKSRNRAIREATGTICVIADDDLIFDADAAERVQSVFAANPDADVITFQARDEEGRPLRRYPAKPHTHTIWTAPNVLSVEIAFRRSAVLESKVTFDERFGLGAEFVSGEENIFIADLIRAGLSVIYFPTCIVTHQGKTSGGQFQDDRVVVSKGAIIRRIYGLISIPVIFIFALKKSATHRTDAFRMLSLMLVGWRKLSEKK